MASASSDNTIDAFIEQDPHSGETQAELRWKTLQPKDTYTIECSSNLSITLDSHQVTRPSRLIWAPGSDPRSTEQLELMFGEELTEAMISTRHNLGLSVVHFALERPQVQAIAHLQLSSVSTPHRLRANLRSMVGLAGSL